MARALAGRLRGLEALAWALLDGWLLRGGRLHQEEALRARGIGERSVAGQGRAA
ncbi:hypothetical protein GKE82_23715 [Conexibacter sp. W3-3-2]|uniref:hypothetical protein n=1 Tax=Conexibacter sp. W3-3-2 TaxID=2675227 RepID=UPI0012B972F2|nr:hypothetical protein [Conexibacter sp. W3-3-2]MTD47214.1 hypothetical protein [Conexibacter sp. W3-3-2]